MAHKVHIDQVIEKLTFDALDSGFEFNNFLSSFLCLNFQIVSFVVGFVGLS